MLRYCKTNVTLHVTLSHNMHIFVYMCRISKAFYTQKKTQGFPYVLLNTLIQMKSKRYFIHFSAQFWTSSITLSNAFPFSVNPYSIRTGTSG